MKSERFEMRLKKADKALIKRAAKVSGESMANFIRLAAIVDAEYTLAGAGTLK